MGYLSKKEFDYRMRKIKLDNISRERKAKLKAEKGKYKQKPKIETSKIMMIYLFVLFNVVIVYAMVAMLLLSDLTYLGVLISDIVAQVVTYGIYCLKAYYGKKQEEQMKFEKEKLYGSINNETDLDNEESDNEEAVG